MKNKIATDYLSLENTKCLKGILAILVLIHHVYQSGGLFQTGALYAVGYICQSLGYLTVALFIFLSGYGLAASTNTEKIKKFPKNKILPFYCIILFFAVIYISLKVILGNEITLKQILLTLTFGYTLISSGWYLQVQLLYYIVFYLVFKYVKQKYQILTIAILQVIYILVCLLFNIGPIYYERTFIFVMGILWFANKDKIDSVLSSSKAKACIFVISAVVFTALYLSASIINNVALEVLLRSLSYFFFVTAVMSVLFKIKINSAVTRFLGEISLEIYMLQGVFMLLLHNEIINITNPYIYAAAVIIGTVALAIAVHPLIKLIYTICRKGKPVNKP